MQGPNPKLIDALSQASSLELFHLSTIIDPHAGRPGLHHGRASEHALEPDGALLARRSQTTR
jgi:hypothetical protein